MFVLQPYSTIQIHQNYPVSTGLNTIGFHSQGSSFNIGYPISGMKFVRMVPASF